MLDALQIAATGMQAQQLHVDTIANNLANVNTNGFKRGRVAFSDLVTRIADSSLASSPLSAVRPLDSVQRIGLGVAVAAIAKQFDAGDMRKTESAFDVAIAGDGFMEVALNDGTRAFSRGGTLKVNGDGLLSLQSGQPLAALLSVPESAQALTIAADGRVQAKLTGQSRAVELGQIELVRFMSPGALAAQGDGLYKSTEFSGEPISGRAGEEPMGTLRQGYVEGSNVKLVDEMVNLMVAQRAYEASVKVAQAADEMLGMVNGLRK